MNIFGSSKLKMEIYDVVNKPGPISDIWTSQVCYWLAINNTTDWPANKKTDMKGVNYGEVDSLPQ